MKNSKSNLSRRSSSASHKSRLNTPRRSFGAAAAAAATAAGMIQVAVIKKQYEAQKAAGFYEGGYTGGRNYRRPAGIVHEGEYVLPHQAIENPAISPFVNLIENARRNNRLASLTPEDVSRTVTAPQAAAMAAKLTAKSAASTAANTGKTATTKAATKPQTPCAASMRSSTRACKATWLSTGRRGWISSGTGTRS